MKSATLILVCVLSIVGVSWAGEAAAPLAAPIECAPSWSSLADSPTVSGITTPDPVPVAQCGFCDSGTFCPNFGVRCSFTGGCTHGQNACCEVACQCGEDCTPRTIPATACAFDPPAGCCLGPRQVCPKTYCGDEGIRCNASGCGVGCCSYSCGPDSSCTAPDPLPLEAC